MKIIENKKNLIIFCSNPVNGGTAEVFVSLCEELLSRGDGDYNVISCVDKGNSVKAFDRLKKIRRIAVSSYEKTFGSYSDEHSKFLKIIRKLKYRNIRKANERTMQSFLEDNNADSVIIHNGGYGGDDLCNQMLDAAYKANIPGERVMVFHSENSGGLLKRIRNIPYDLMIKRDATKVVSVSSYTKNLIEGSSLLRNIQVVKNGIMTPKDIDYKKEETFNKYDKNAINFLHVSNFFEIKGQIYLIKAFSEAARSTDKNIRLTLIGNVYEEDYYQRCLGEIKQNGIEDRIEIVHNLYNAKDYLDMFDVFMFSSVESESLPLVLIEAMSRGLPVIAFDCGGTREAIDNGKDGIIIPKRDTRKMADAIVSLAEDTEARVRMGKSAYEHYLREFTRQAMGDRYLALLQK